MDRFFDMESPPCEHVLVKTIKLTRKCEKCRQFKWPWSKAVGCIKCMNIWHRRCGSFERVADERVVKPCTVQPTAVVNVEKNNPIVGTAKAVKNFLKHPCRRIRRRADHIRTAGVAQQLSGQPLLATLSDTCPAIARPVKSPGAEDAGPARAITLDAQPLTSFSSVESEANNAVSTRVITLAAWPANFNPIGHSFKWPKQITVGKYLERYIAQRSSELTTKRVKWPWSKISMFFARPVLYTNMVQVDVKTEKIESTVITADSIIGKFSYHRHFQQSFRKLTITWTATGAEELYRQLLPAVAVDSWPLPIVLLKTIRPKIITTTVGTTLTNVFKTPLAIASKSLTVTQSTTNTVTLAITAAPSAITVVSPAITAAPPNITAAPPAVINSSPAITIAPPVITVASPSIAAAPPAITTASSTITTASPSITNVPTSSPNNSLCHRPNCKNRRCRRRQIIAAARATNNNY